MDAKFQEYLDQISSEKYGEDVRSAIQHALVYLYDRFLRQGTTIDKERQFANDLLDDVWDAVIDLAAQADIHDVERINLIDEGYDDLVNFTHDLVSFLRLFKNVTKQFPELSDYSELGDMRAALEVAFRTHIVTEEIRMVDAIDLEHLLPDGSSVKASGNIAVVPIDDVITMHLTVSYNDLFPSLRVTSLSKNYPGYDTRPIVCLSSTIPPSDIKNAMEYLTYVTGSDDPDNLEAVTDFGDMVPDTVYRIDHLSTYVYPIDITDHPYTVSGTIDKQQLAGVKCIVLGQVSRGLDTYDTYYDGNELSLISGVVGSVHATLEMGKVTYLNR